LIILRPTRSTLFPYTTLFRSKKYRGDIANALPDAHWLSICDGILAVEIVRDARSHHFDQPATFSVTVEEREAIENLGPRVYQARSEEHTSELQSLRHLVCRLL